MKLATKKIAIGVTGGIAAYKSFELIRELKKSGAEVRVAMTDSARKFVTNLTLATLSENPVLDSLFEGNEKLGTVHIDLARWCDVFVICPATANIIAKAAAGLADDVITTSILATQAKVIFCPAMNSVMWEKPIVQQNITRLKELGCDFVDPEWGKLATKAEGEGWGRLASIESIVQKLEFTLLATSELVGKKVLVTAGPTRERIDPVRFITNYSSGKMGFALAEAAKLKGADVVLISGPNNLNKPQGLKYVEVETVEELRKAVEAEYEEADILLMSAAVSDYQTKKASAKKIKKTSAEITLQLKRSPDILALLGKKKADCIHIGFALETENGVENATEKLNTKNLDLIVLNNPLEPGAAFGGDTNIVSIINKDKQVETFTKLPKNRVAEIILNKAVEILQDRNRQVIAV
ncbi:MAG: bifunctional phosphopantothenoylcysteine decarboxylase/phosphopantothenate--cysteine ligase CoaBC [Caldithrix sp.]|nr:MAG: bifunctional phosphopantothenoylcysteine decarboxylase/phosphopantothenate--cysteine ligase CoaBC [Caldithrix sp.]